MRLPPRVTHEFVELIPAEREEGKVYISIPYSTVVHNCLCGCGTKVVTPIKPNKWTLTYDGESISLSPSVGNWGFHCRSHYWIRGSRVFDAGPMPQAAIEYGRARDAALTDRYHTGSYAPVPVPDQRPVAAEAPRAEAAQPQQTEFLRASHELPLRNVRYGGDSVEKNPTSNDPQAFKQAETDQE